MTASEQKRWRLAKEIFEAACEESPLRQQQIVREMVAGDLDLAADVQRLLSMQDDSGLTLDSTAQPLGPGMYAPGEVLSDRYRIERYLSSGGMGDVYAARDMRTGGRVAVKFVRPFAASQRDIEARFLREVRLAQKIVHPNVCRMIALDMHKGVRYCVMELLEGQTLADRLQSRGRMTPEEALPVAVQVCEALQAAHEAGVLHRDIKPGNIFLVGDRALLIDFGLAAALLREGSLTSAGVVIGTLAYVAPEQLEHGKASQASDIYSLGVVLHEMLMGRKPHEAKSPFRLARQKATEVHEELVRSKEIPSVWGEVLTRCLKARPEARYQSAHEVRKALERGRPSVRFRFGKPLVWAPALAALLMLLLWAGWWLALRDYQPSVQVAQQYDDAAAAMAQSSLLRSAGLLQQAVSKDPAFVKGAALLAVVHAETDQLDRARQAILEATMASDRRLLLGRGERYALDGARAAVLRDFQLSAEQYGRWAGIAKGLERANALLLRGRMLDQAGKAEEALATFKLAVREQPSIAAAHISLALQLCRRLEFDAAARHFSDAERALRQSRNYEGLTELLLARAALRKQTQQQKRQDLDEASVLVKRTGNVMHRLSARLRHASLALESKDYKEAGAISREVADEARRNGLQFLALRALSDMGYAFLYAQQPERSLGILEEAIAYARQMKSYHMLAENQSRLGEALIMLERREAALAYIRPAVEWYRNSHHRDLPYVLIKYGTALGDQPGQSDPIYREALDAARREGNAAYETMALHRLMRSAGPVSARDAVAYAHQLLPLARKMPHHRAMIQIAEHLRDFGSYGEARKVIQEAEAAIARYPEGVDREFLQIRAQVFYAQEAFYLRNCEEGLTLLRQVRLDNSEVHPFATYVRIQLQNCSEGTAKAVLERNLQEMTRFSAETKVPRRLGQIFLVHGEIAMRLKRWSVARKSARKGVEVAKSIGESYYAFLSEMLLRAVERQSGNHAAADALTASTLVLAKQIGFDDSFNGRKDLQVRWAEGSR
ncbi:MAG: protein kinase [Acidobacteria bacterium]|nr:protein kinase [Acidobacteriota bacterium]